MPTADEDCGNACGYVEDFNVAATAQAHHPKQSGDKNKTANTGVVVIRKYCVLRLGHAAGHSFRTQ